MNVYLLAALCILGWMTLLFVVAHFKKDNSIADIGWGLGFIIVTWVTLEYSHTNYGKQRLLIFLVLIWGLRLASYIGIRNWGKPEDFRYANWRKEWGDKVAINSFLRVFLLQGFIMFLMCLPIITVNSTPRTVDLKFFYPLGAAIWALGFFIEGIADHEMFFFKESPAHKGRVMDKGLWKYSRHPNYFGEMLVWWGIFFIAVPSGYWYISIISPVLITFLLLKVSGVTMLEKKYEGNDDYSAYKRRTSAFVPWFPKQV
jgi:steroid 5-alpha reductase family enzyme